MTTSALSPDASFSPQAPLQRLSPAARGASRRGAIILVVLGVAFLFLGWLSLCQLGCSQRPEQGQPAASAPATSEKSIESQAPKSPSEASEKATSAKPEASTQGPRPDVLLVTFDTLRYDHLGCYGYDRPTTPNVDRAAAEGIRFEQAYAPMAVTLPSHLTLFTSILPPNHGVVINGVPIDRNLNLMAERLKAAGYSTAGFVSSYVLRTDKFFIGDGFDHYSAEGKGDRQGHAVTNEAIEFLDKNADKQDRAPFFLWVHYIDPHDPYDPPEVTRYLFKPQEKETFSREQIVALYDGEIAYLDLHFGRLYDRFAKLSRPNGRLIMALSDHGEELFEHGWRGHGPHLYDESVRIPFVMSWPGRLKAGAVVRDTVSIADVLPTLLGFLKLPFESHPLHVGLDFSRSLLADASISQPEDRPFFFIRRHYDEKESGMLSPRPAERFVPEEFVVNAKDGRKRIYDPIPLIGDRFGVRVGKWKYQTAPDEPVKEELYDMVADPKEKNNVAAEHPDVVAKLAKLVADWRKTHPANVVQKADEDDEDTMQALRALGYVDDEADDDEAPARRNRAKAENSGTPDVDNGAQNPETGPESPETGERGESGAKKGRKADGKKDGGE